MPSIEDFYNDEVQDYEDYEDFVSDFVGTIDNDRDREALIQAAVKKWGMERTVVEEKINTWFEEAAWDAAADRQQRRAESGHCQ